MSEIDIFGDSESRKYCKNRILGMNNVDQKPEPNVQKKFFFDHVAPSAEQKKEAEEGKMSF